MPDALAQAAQGKELSAKKANTAVGEALDKMASMKKRAEGMKEQMATTGTAVLETGLLQGSCFAVSFAAGAAGEKWIKPGGYVDLRPVGAAVLGAWGFYDVISGGDKGGLILATANGIGASWIAEVGKGAGVAMQEKWQKAATETPAVTPAAGTPGTPAIGQQRDVRLTPERRGLRRRREDEYAD